MNFFKRILAFDVLLEISAQRRGEHQARVDIFRDFRITVNASVPERDFKCQSLPIVSYDGKIGGLYGGSFHVFPPSKISEIKRS